MQMNAVGKQYSNELITDPEQVQAFCLFLLGRDAKPGEVLELRHVRDELFEIMEVKGGGTDGNKSK
jgi:hypothetical protein